VKKLFNGLETDYLDGFQYKFTHTWEAPSGTMTTDEIKLRIIPTAEGYYDALRNAYFYNYTDHLGNVRVSYSDRDGNNEVTGDIVVNNCYNTPDGMVCNNYIITGEAEGVTNYYPFGMIHNSEYNTFDNAYQNKYNGKELQETGMYDYGARMYMSDIGRWGVVDPMAEVTPHLSPYHYGNNNPLMFNDPTGMLSMSVLNSLMGSASGTTWYNTGIGFTSDAGGSMDYDGNKISWGSDYTDMLMMSVGLGPMGSGGGGGDVAGERLLAPLVINLPESYKGNKALTMISFSMGFQQHLSTYLGIWQQGFDSMAWVRNDGPIQYIGGAGDPFGILEAGGIALAARGDGSANYILAGLLITRSGNTATTLKLLNAERGAFSVNKHGNLTDGMFTVSKDAMLKHKIDLGIGGKSIFYPTVNADEAVLKAAQYAEKNNLWIYNAGTKAKVPVLNTNVGTLGNGQPTNFINVYKSANNLIHGAPGTPK
jgi:RHS repeat-associated protein